MTREHGITLGKKRSDCSEECIDVLIRMVEERAQLPGAIAELGAYKCGATIAMASVTDKTIYSFDTFGGLPYAGQNSFLKFGCTDFQEIKQTCWEFKNIVHVRGRHEDTVPQFAVQPLSLIFMDSDFHSSHVVGLRTLFPMLVSGGAIVFHDWTFHEVQQAIQEKINPDECSFIGPLQGPLMGAIIKR